MSSQPEKSNQLQSSSPAGSIHSIASADAAQKPDAPRAGSKAESWNSARTYEHKTREAHRKLGFHSVD